MDFKSFCKVTTLLEDPKQNISDKSVDFTAVFLEKLKIFRPIRGKDRHHEYLFTSKSATLLQNPRRTIVRLETGHVVVLKNLIM